MTLQAQGRHGFNRSQEHHGDDGVAGSGRMMALRAQGRRGSMASWAQEWCRVHIVVGLGRTTLLRTRERRRGLEDGACVVDDVTNSSRGRWRRIKGLDSGRER
jgi:hypothetical protein